LLPAGVNPRPTAHQRYMDCRDRPPGRSVRQGAAYSPAVSAKWCCFHLHCHCETSSQTGRGNPFLFAGSFCMGKVLLQEYGLPRRSAPRNDSERETHCEFARGAIVVVTIPCADRQGCRFLHPTIVTRFVGAIHESSGSCLKRMMSNRNPLYPKLFSLVPFSQRKETKP